MPVIASRGAASAGGFGSSSPYHQPAIIFNHLAAVGTPFAYRWDDTNGIGEAYASPPGWTGTQGTFIRTSLDEKIVAVGSYSALNAYEWNGQYSGFVRKYAEPASYSGINIANNQALGWNADKTRAMTSSGSGSGFSCALINWSDAGFGTKLTYTGTNPQYAVNTASKGQVHPSGLYWVMGGNAYSGTTAAYRFDNALTQGHLPTYAGAGYGGGLGQPPFNYAWSPDGNYIFGGYSQNSSPNDGPNGIIYSFDPNSGVSIISTFYPNGPMKFSFNRAGTHLFGYGTQRITGRIGAASVFIYDGAGGITRMADGPTGSTIAGITAAGPPSFNKTDTRVLVGINTAPFYAIYEWSNTTGLGARLTMPSVGLTAYNWATFI